MHNIYLTSLRQQASGLLTVEAVESCEYRTIQTLIYVNVSLSFQWYIEDTVTDDTNESLLVVYGVITESPRLLDLRTPPNLCTTESIVQLSYKSTMLEELVAEWAEFLRELLNPDNWFRLLIVLGLCGLGGGVLSARERSKRARKINCFF